MAVFKCKMCGGALEVNEGMTVCECEYCGTTQTISKTDNEQTINMLNRASHFRQQCEFDKAMEIYERLLNSSDKDSEIYWQIALCRYGIEYVDDPLTKKKIPTCHRMQFKSILNDADYLEALNHADSIQKDVYIKEAEYIDSIQKGILEISNKEEPFDVFICYKESDENGKRTKDSVLAQDLYYQLEREGFKVFFSRITLEGKLGTVYEPYIFAALNSSKVMVVVGTKQEYFNAVWVRNEWSRFLMLMQKNKSKTIIPAYKDMDPYDLPDALSMFQAQDMSKLGFMQDLIRGIKKLTGTNEPAQKSKNNKISLEQNPNTSKLLKRAFIALEDEEWENANVFCEQALNNEPECAEAYLVKLLVELKLKNEDELLNSSSNFFDNRNYKKHYKYSDKERKKILDNFSNEIIYRKAKNEFDNNKYLEASDYFKSISGYEDSEEMSKECIYILAENCFEKGLYSDAESIFKQIPDYKDAEKMAKECLYILATSHFEKDLYSEAESIFKQIPDYKDAEKMAKECLYILATSRFERALYSDAENIFKQIPDYKDANKMAKECLYVLATSRFEKGLYSDAENAFKQILDYKDSKSMIEECHSQAKEAKKINTLNSAIELMKSSTKSNIENALEMLNTIKDWKNANVLISECESRLSKHELTEKRRLDKIRRKRRIIIISTAVTGLIATVSAICVIATVHARKYDEAMEKWKKGEYDYSYNLLAEIPDYKDSANAMKLLSVLSGQITDYDEKVKILESLGDYRDSAEVLLDLKYEKASEYANDKNYREAVNLIDSLEDYGDPDNIKNNIYTTAVDYFDERKFPEAAEIFLIFDKYEDSEAYIEKIYNEAKAYEKNKKLHYAAAVYLSLKDYKDSKDKVEEIYQKCLEPFDNEKYTDVIPIFLKLKDYKDSEAKLEDIYNKAIKLVEDKKYDNAAKIFEKFGKYKDSEKKLNDISELKKKDKYDKAVKLGNDGKYDEAIKLFEELEDYSDSKSQLAEMKKKRDADTYEMKGTTAWVVIDNGYLNVRKTANSDAESVGKLYNGDEVTIQATSNDKKWYKVTSGGITGYCSVDYISTSKPIANISGSWIETNDNIESSMFNLSGEWQQIGGTYSMTLTKDGDDYKAIIEYEVSGSDRPYRKIRFTAKPNGSNNSYSYQLGRYEERHLKNDITPVYTCFVNGNFTYSDGYLLWDCYNAEFGDIFEDNVDIQFERN